MLYLSYTLKDIQTWLDHSSYNFTADTYYPLRNKGHEQIAESLSGKLKTASLKNLLLQKIRKCIRKTSF